MRTTKQEQIADLSRRLAIAEELFKQSDTALRASQKRGAELSESVDTLKERHASALAEIARLKGYIERVHETEDAAAPRVPITDDRPMITAPATRLAREEPRDRDVEAMRFYGTNGSNGRPRHWTAL